MYVYISICGVKKRIRADIGFGIFFLCAFIHFCVCNHLVRPESLTYHKLCHRILFLLYYSIQIVRFCLELCKMSFTCIYYPNQSSRCVHSVHTATNEQQHTHTQKALMKVKQRKFHYICIAPSNRRASIFFFEGWIVLLKCYYVCDVCALCVHRHPDTIFSVVRIIIVT